MGARILSPDSGTSRCGSPLTHPPTQTQVSMFHRTLHPMSHLQSSPLQMQCQPGLGLAHLQASICLQWLLTAWTYLQAPVQHRPHSSSFSLASVAKGSTCLKVKTVVTNDTYWTNAPHPLHALGLTPGFWKCHGSRPGPGQGDTQMDICQEERFLLLKASVRCCGSSSEPTRETGVPQATCTDRRGREMKNGEFFFF